ncbi:MAG: glutaredoxin family protein [Chloroflexota bacterium]
MNSTDTTNELVMYSRTSGCPFVTLAKRVLGEHGVPYREIFYDRDDQARERLLAWTGFLSVPTLIIARRGEDVPLGPVAPLPPGDSPRGIDRGAMITEPNITQLIDWLKQHGLIAQAGVQNPS